jgi:hypothetical protein
MFEAADVLSSNIIYVEKPEDNATYEAFLQVNVNTFEVETN